MSAVILAKPAWANTGLRWIEALDDPDLIAMSNRAKPFRRGADVLAGMITEAVRKEFEPMCGNSSGPGCKAHGHAHSKWLKSPSLWGCFRAQTGEQPF